MINNNNNNNNNNNCRGDVLGIVARVRPGRPLNFGLISDGTRLFYSQKHSHSLLFSGYREDFLGGPIGRGVKLTSHLWAVPRLRMTGGLPPLPVYTFMTFTGWSLSFHLFQVPAIVVRGKKASFETASLTSFIALPYSCAYVSRNFTDLCKNVLIQYFC
jgi:hypothetical protein